MDQLVVLQEIYASFSKGTGSLREIDINAIEGCCSDLVAGLLEDSLNGRIGEEICRELSEKLTDVYELKRLGDICRRAGLARLATDTYKKAISLCVDPVLSPILKNNLGQAYADQGNINRAMSYYREAADIFTREGDRISLAHVLGNLGSAYRKVGDYGRAIESAHRSLKIFEEDEDRLGIAQMTGSIGRIYADMGERELAARYFERSLADFQRLGDKRGAAWILSRLGGMARESGELNRALGYMHSSISIWEGMGERANLGAVLADLGSTLLQMGQPSAARDPLERAVLLIPEHSRLNYQKALSSLARAYSSLAKESIGEALKVEGSDLPTVAEKRRQAARLFASSADRYQELADTLPNAEIRSEAALARGRSYLSRIYEQMPEQEAMILVEKAMAALESAASSSNEEKKPGILILQRITSGLWQARRTDQIAHDPQEMRAALSCSAEYLMQAAGSLFSGSAADHLLRALECLKSAIETEVPGAEQEKRDDAALSLRQAVRHLAVQEKENADAVSRMMERAAERLEAPDGLEKRQEDGGRDNDGGREDGSDSLAWSRERAALLALAEAMAICNLICLQEDYGVPGSQDSPEPADRDKSEAETNFLDIAEEDGLAQETEEESLPPSHLLEDWGRRDAKENDLALAEGSMEGASSLSWARAASPEWGRSCNEPAQSFQNGSCLLLPRDGTPLERALFQAEPGTEAYAGTKERLEWDKPTDMEEESERELLRETFRESPGGSYNGTIYRYEAPDEEIEEIGLQFNPALDDLEMEPSAHPISPRVIAALRVLSILVLLLLLIEAMLYLI